MERKKDYYKQKIVVSQLIDEILLIPCNWENSPSAALLGSDPEGADDLCFHTGEISPPSSSPPSPSPSTPFEAHILALRLKSQPIGPNPSPEAQILTSSLTSQPQGSHPNFEAQILA